MSVKASQIGNIKRKRLARDEQYARHNRDLAAMILRARDAGATWPMLASAMGITRQGLEKFLKREASSDPERCPKCGGYRDDPQEVDPGSAWEGPLPLCDDSFHD